MEVSRVKGYRSEAEKGAVDATYRWTDRVEHPANMGKYDDWANDAEANIAFNVLTDIIAGVSYYTEMPDEVPEAQRETHKNKIMVDTYGKDVNLDEDLQEIVMAMLQKGFSPVQRLKDYDLHILPPESFFIWRTKTGTVYRYTQERARGDVIRIWQDSNWQKHLNECKEAYTKEEFKEWYSFEVEKDLVAGTLDDIILFFHRKTTSWPYGKSLTEPIGSLLDDRNDMNEDMAKAIHRWGYPIPIMKTSKAKDALAKELEDRESDEWIVIGNVVEGEVNMDTLKIDPQARFVPFIELIYYQICEGLHAPLLLYLKNATEASATVMMESVDRLVNGIQRYVKRRVERYLFEPQCGEPVPRLVWGQPKTGLEEVTLEQVATLAPFIAPNQLEDLLKQLGLQLPEPEWPKQPTMLPQQPFQKPQPQVPMQQMVDKLNDLGTALDVIELNLREKRIPLVQAMKLGSNAIEVYCQRMLGRGEAYKKKRDEEFRKWVKRLVGKEGHVYSVSVGD